MSWLYQEYGAAEGTGIPGDDPEIRQSYSECLLNLMDGLYSKLDAKDKLVSSFDSFTPGKNVKSASVFIHTKAFEQSVYETLECDHSN